jgi:regulator of protease activity HflC (stomatin/prohibitin superfamily)
MITGDGNLLEVQASIRYTISNPRIYLFEVADPARVLRNATESVLREIVAGSRMARLLTSDRGTVQQEVRKRLQDRCEASRPGGLGLSVEGVSLHDMHPPQQVVQAYHDVTRAMEKRDRLINEATADRLRRRRDQEARDLETVRTAQADRFTRIRTATALQEAFLFRQRARGRLSWANEVSLLWRAISSHQDGQPLAVVKQDYTRQRRKLLDEQRALTDFRLFWDTVSDALSGRSKVLIDTDRLPGRRMLWLAPFQPMQALPGAAPRIIGDTTTTPQGRQKGEP